jgi:putative nucleotidyltransferase with HDIG domain
MGSTTREEVLRLLPEIEEISDAGLREKVVDAWLLALEESRWARIEDEPWIPGGAEFITNVQHCRGVTRIGIAVARILLEGSDIAPGARVDLDVVIAGCLLHDVGKLLEYCPPEPGTGVKTALGAYMMHHILGTHVAMKAGLPADVIHCIESHREPESFERSFEAKIVHYSDVLHAYGALTAHPEISIF